MPDGQQLRRRGGGAPAQLGSGATAAAPPGQAGAKAWHLWMLFGLGWPSLLFFMFSSFSFAGGTAQWLLLSFGWLFAASWGAGAAAGAAFGNRPDALSPRQRTAWMACVIMAGVGGAVGGLFSLTWAWHHLPLLQIFGAVLAACVVVAALLAGSNGGKEAQEGEQPAASAAGEGAAAAEGPPVGGGAADAAAAAAE